jgi:peptidoglycan endopeptidase LytF
MVVEFSDRPRRPRERADRARVVVFEGRETAELEPASTFEAAGGATGMAPEGIEALRYVSEHEGGFDAINTWDSARFSWGFIQFAGGRGLPLVLGHMKARNPDLFRKVLGSYGVDVLPDEDGRPQPIYVQARTGRVLRGKAAEQAYGDDPLTIAAFIRAARLPEVKQLQVEAAIRHYAGPALKVTYLGIPISRILRSPKSLAMLIDRKVHEGNVGRFSRAMDSVAAAGSLFNPAEWPHLEARVLRQVVSDAAARSGWMIQGRLRKIMDSELPGPQAAS